MRKFGAFSLVVVALAGLAGLASAQAKAVPDLDRLKSLVGEWQGKGSDGKTITVSYELTSGGSAVIETLQPADEPRMVTIYHADNDKLMMTHYCSLNNQPRMRGVGDDRSLTFSFVDATNLSSPAAPHMHNLVLTFQDKDHLMHEWTMKAAGQDRTVVFRLKRKN